MTLVNMCLDETLEVLRKITIELIQRSPYMPLASPTRKVPQVPSEKLRLQSPNILFWITLWIPILHLFFYWNISFCFLDYEKAIEFLTKTQEKVTLRIPEVSLTKTFTDLPHCPKCPKFWKFSVFVPNCPNFSVFVPNCPKFFVSHNFFYKIHKLRTVVYNVYYIE